jgi:hypothetical protein
MHNANPGSALALKTHFVFTTKITRVKYIPANLHPAI